MWKPWSGGVIGHDDAARFPVNRRTPLDKRDFPSAAGGRATHKPEGRLALGVLMAGMLTSAVMAQARAEAQQPKPPIADPEVIGAPVNDPFIAFNRASYGFSRGVDHWVTGPIAHAYMTVAPDPVRERIGAAVTNLGEPRTLLNDIAQGRPRRAGVTASRFVINSTAGMLGFFDVATDLDLPHHRGDFGQTLGRYGVKPGAFLYVPVLGPTTIREGAGRVVDLVTDPVTLIGGSFRTTFGAARLGATALDARSRLDPQVRALENATDPYATVRSAYLQRRAALVRETTDEVQVLPDFEETTPASHEFPPSAVSASAPGSL